MLSLPLKKASDGWKLRNSSNIPTQLRYNFMLHVFNMTEPKTTAMQYL